MIPDAALLYFVGAIMGALLSWFIIQQRLSHSPGMAEIVREATTQAAFIRATGDVVDDETGEEIRERANDVLDEYDVPGDPEWRYDS